MLSCVEHEISFITSEPGDQRTKQLFIPLYTSTLQGFPFNKIFTGHCDPQVVDFGGHFQFERVTHFILPFSKYNQSYFTSQSSQNTLGLDVFLGVLGPGCDSSESSLSLFHFSVADEKNNINFDCDIFVDWFIAYQ